MSIEDPRISATASENVSHDFRQDIHEDASIDVSAAQGVEVAQADNSQQPEKTDRVPQAPQTVAANVHPAEIVPDQNNVAHLPADVSIDDIRVEGNNLVLVQADGTEIVIVNGALHVPTFLLGEVELPQQAVIAALEQNNINVAAGPDGSYSASASAPSSGADFQDTIQQDPNDPTQLAQLLADTQQGDPTLGSGEDVDINNAPIIELMDSLVYNDTANDDEFPILRGVVPGRDIDNNDVLRYGVQGGLPLAGDSNYDIVKVGSYGELRLNSVTGAYIFTPNDAAIEGLKDHQSESFTFTVTDKSGASGTQVWTVDVNGVNDTASISGDAAAKLVEDAKGNTIASGQLTVGDRDTGDGHFQDPSAEAKEGHYGTFTFDAQTGAWTYRLNNASSAIQGLAANQVVHETLTVVSADGTATQVIDITITGTNDAPVIGGEAILTGKVSDVAETVNPALDAGMQSANGSLTFTDVDLTDRPEASFAVKTVTTSEGLTLSSEQEAALKAAFSVTNAAGNSHDGTVNWSYSIAESALDFLAKGQSVELTYAITVDDGHGGTDSRDVTVTITGENDVPVLTASTGDVQAWSVNAGNHLDLGDAFAGGNVLDNAHANDVDTGDKLTVVGVAAGAVVDGASVSGHVGSLIEGKYGYLTLSANGGWVYTLNNLDGDTRALVKGAHANDVFTYTVTDKYGATATQTLTIDVTGGNSAPDAHADVNLGAAVTEQGVNPGNAAFAGNDSASGNVLANDTDVDTVGGIETKTVIGVAAGVSIFGASGHVGTEIVGKYGTLTLSADGTWNYKLNNDDPDTQKLGQGDRTTEVFTYTMADATGATSTSTLSIAITGTNDAPVIDGTQHVSGDVREAGNLDSGAIDAGTSSISDQLTKSDVDVDDRTSNDSWSVVTAAGDVAEVTDTYGKFSVNQQGRWTYTLDNNDSDTQALFEGQTIQRTFTVKVTDSHGAYATQLVKITITGTNDVPVLKASTGDVQAWSVNAGNHLDFGNAFAGGNVLDNAHANDVDTGDKLTVVGVAAGAVVDGASVAGDVGKTIEGTYGSLKLSANGSWTYTLDNTDADTRALVKGAHANDVFTYTVTDKYGATATQTLTIDVTGGNSAPDAHADVNLGAAVTERGVNPGNTEFAGNDSASGNVLTNDTDVDTVGGIETKSVIGVAAGVSIFGASGHVGTEVVGTYGTLTLNADGTWNYKLNNNDTNTQKLAQGERATEVFTYTMTDAAGATSTSTLSIAITGTNDAPVAQAQVNG
ncbi:VCBS domain-containing protein, partial [Rhizobium grahamii]